MTTEKQVPGGSALAYRRQEAVARWAQMVRDGQATRETRFTFSAYNGPEIDLTTEVLEAAGEETPEEREKRAEFENSMLWARIQSDIQVEMDARLGGIMRPHFAGEDFVWDEDAEDSNEFVLISTKEGRKFRVEVEVNVEEIAES